MHLESRRVKDGYLTQLLLANEFEIVGNYDLYSLRKISIILKIARINRFLFSFYNNSRRQYESCALL